jgi:predicted 3-demethylubiquinone-9 3-methyltransferase (glyoxalase superfamily)
MAPPVYPCLWFNNQAHEAAAYYCRVFPNSRITSSNPMAVLMELNGVRFMALNGGSEYAFNEAISFVVTCETQEEIDHYWNTFTNDGGTEGRCGWLKDKYGVSWQIVPSVLGQLMGNPEKAPKAMYAFMQMKKFDIAKLLEATAA